MLLARLEGGSRIGHTATTDNAVQKHYLKAYAIWNVEFVPNIHVSYFVAKPHD